MSYSAANAGEIVSRFFDTISAAYDDSIFRGCPVYRDILEGLLDHLWLDRNAPLDILELGCGTGNLTTLLAQTFPNARLTVVDISPEMLGITQNKLAPLTRHLEAVESDFNALDFSEGRFDLVISSLAIHHLLDADKARLYQNIYRWLKPGGKFRCADQCLTVPAEIGAPQNQERWLAMARQNGAHEEEIAMWVEHGETSDHHAPVAAHFQWLAAAGFVHIDCYWRKIFWTLYGGEKPGTSVGT